MEYISLNGMPKEMLEIVSVVNAFVSQVKEMHVALKENVPNFFLKGLIKGNEYTAIKKQLGDIHELVGKFENIEWNPFCINKISGDVVYNDTECSAIDELKKMSE